MSSTPLLNADGLALPLSESALNYSPTIIGEASTGTAGADWLQESSTVTTLIGGDGDDTYVLGTYGRTPTSPVTDVVEHPGGGVDTVYSFYDYYKLADNVENLITSGWGEGNALNNIITAMGTAHATLDGGAGNDILVGNHAGDTFIVRAGNGSDVIDNFTTGAGGDTLRLDNYGFKTFADVQAAATQVGADTVIHLSTTESLTLHDTHLSDLTAANYAAPVSTAGMTLTFDDEFNSFSMEDQTTGVGTWRTNFNYAGYNMLGSRTLPTSGEKELYVDPAFQGTTDHALGLNPFVDHDGVLDIHIDKVSPALSQDLYGYQYTSGLITTLDSFSQKYGYFEVSAKVPSGQGLWPCIWLLNADGTYPPELDMLESIGDATSAHETSHTSDPNFQSVDSTTSHVYPTDDGYHTYGLSWTADELIWYIDGQPVKSMATPADMNKPMYLLINTVVGGSWAGDPDPSTDLHAVMSINYVRVYSSDPNAAAVTPQDTSPTPGVDSPTGASTATPDPTPVVVPPAPTEPSTPAQAAPNPTPDPVVVHTDPAPASTPDPAAAPVDTTPMVTVEGNGWVDGGGGHKTLVGIGDSNYYWVTDVTDTVVSHTGADDTVMSSVNWTLGANTNKLLLQGSADLIAHGNDAGDSIFGNAGADHLYGGAGNDYLDDNGGGGTVGTYMSGGAGDNIFVVSNANDQLVAMAGGHNTVLSSVSWTLGANFDKLQLQGSANIDAHGNDAGDTLIGNSGDNHIYGGAGNDYIQAGSGTDVIDGGGGNDYIVAGSGLDTFVFRPGTGHATVTGFNASLGDMIDLSAFHGLSHTLAQWGADAVIDLGGGAMVTLVGVNATDPSVASHITWG